MFKIAQTPMVAHRHVQYCEPQWLGCDAASEIVPAARPIPGASIMRPIPVFLVESNPAFLRIVTQLLQDYYQEELTLVGTSNGADHILHQIQILQPRIILLGLNQHHLGMLQVIPHVRASLPQSGIIVLGFLDVHAYREAALAAGADAFIAKAVINRELLPTIQMILNPTHIPPPW